MYNAHVTCLCSNCCTAVLFIIASLLPIYFNSTTLQCRVIPASLLLRFYYKKVLSMSLISCRDLLIGDSPRNQTNSRNITRSCVRHYMLLELFPFICVVEEFADYCDRLEKTSEWGGQAEVSDCLVAALFLGIFVGLLTLCVLLCRVGGTSDIHNHCDKWSILVGRLRFMLIM